MSNNNEFLKFDWNDINKKYNDFDNNKVKKCLLLSLYYSFNNIHNNIRFSTKIKKTFFEDNLVNIKHCVNLIDKVGKEDN